MVALIDSTPRGAAEFSGGEIGIVLGEETAATIEDEPGSDLTATEPTVTPPAVAPEPTPTAAPSEPAATDIAPARAGPTRVAQAPGGRPGNYGPGDSQASVKVFGVEGKGSKFVYVFDRSTSMEGPPLATAKRQLIASLESLSSVHQFHIIFFNQQVRHSNLGGGGQRIAFATDRNKKLASRFISGIGAEGGTDRFPALRAAVSMRPDVIFFLTDADDPMSASELEEIATLNRRAGVTICTIEFGRGPAKAGKSFLTELARLSGGQYGYVDTLNLPR